ncbi:uncharacterized protein LOC144066671 isoform X2 [Stigmatopora argus]
MATLTVRGFALCAVSLFNFGFVFISGADFIRFISFRAIYHNITGETTLCQDSIPWCEALRDSSVLKSLLVDMALLALFTTQHSLLAWPPVKQVCQSMLGSLNRTAYCFTTALALQALMHYWQPVTSAPCLWSVRQAPWSVWFPLFCFTMHFFCWAIICTIIMMFDYPELMGIKQICFLWRRHDLATRRQSGSRSIRRIIIRSRILLARNAAIQAKNLPFFSSSVMSVSSSSSSSLPEWKQLLLERKRREEEERERREKEEEEKFSKMPAWKRGIIQRRKAKQEILVDREKERDLSSIPLVDAQPIVDILSDTDNWLTVSQGNEQFLHPDPSQSPDVDLISMSQVSVETIVPVHENPFMLTQNVWRKGKDDVGCQERSSELEIQEREKDKSTPKSHDGETARGRKIEKKIEKFRDLSEGRDKDKNRDRSQERDNNWEIWEKAPCKDSPNDMAKEKELLKEENAGRSFSPLVPCLRTIRADNIIIIEQNCGASDEKRAKWREMEAERPEEDLQGKRGMKMDLREILAGGASVTEIRASDVLIIKPTLNSEERPTAAAAAAGGAGGAGGAGKGLGREDIEMCTMEAKMENWCRELRTEMSWTREKEISKEKDRPCGQAVVIKDNKKDSLDDNVFYERGGRVSQLLSKFGEFRKPPSRSKSSDNFLRPGRWKNSRENDDRNEERTYHGRNVPVKGVPKRSFSFSDRIVTSKENGLDPDGWKPRERIHSDRSGTSYAKEMPVKCKMGSSPFLEKDQFVKRQNGTLSNQSQSDAIERKNDTGVGFQKRTEDKKLELGERTATGTPGEEDIEGFMMASIKTTEGISFARRIPIRQDGKARTAEKDARKPTKKAFKLDLGAEKDSHSGLYSEGHICDKRDELDKSEACIHRSTAENCFKIESDHKESSNLLSTVPDRGAEWDLLSHHTEELIHKIEKIVDAPDYINDKSEKSYNNKQGVHNESIAHDVNPRPPKGIAAVGIPPGPLEIQIPRTVFYVADEMARKKTTSQSMEVKNSEGGKGVERKDSWRAGGKPLSRVESLREKIRQREQESLRQKTSQGMNGVDVKMISDALTEGDPQERGGTEKEKELESLTPLQNRMIVEAKTEVQTSGSAFDTMQEVDVLKKCPQLPVSVLNSTTVSGEEVSSSPANAPFQDSDEGLQISKDKRDTLKHVEEQVTHRKGQDQGGEGGQVEDTRDPEEEGIESYKSSVAPAQPLSHSPPHPNSLAAMSRIYNLETVGSRSGLCLRERNVDVSSVHLVKVKPLVTSDALKGDAKVFSGDTRGIKTRPLQIEQLQHKEQESVQTENVASTSTTCKDMDAKGRQSKGLKKHQAEDTMKETPEVHHKVCPRRVFSPTSQLKQPNPIIASHLRSRSPDKSLKPSDCAPTPASSPCSSSPSASPSPSPTFFSIRSASGGQVKRGATITITPQKSTGTERTIGTPTSSTPVTSVNTKIPQLMPQTQTTSSVAETVQKKYPTVDEIEVIGGYQNLEKSCLIRTKGPPKRGKVCFDENKLEQVCEYPSETSMLVSTPFPQDLERTEMLPGEEPKEEEGEADVRALMSKSPKNLGTALGRVLRVDESCPR